MKTRKKPLPGEPGTTKRVRQYGENLVCVRCHYEPEQEVTIKRVIERIPLRKNSQKIPITSRYIFRSDTDEPTWEEGPRPRVGNGTEKKRVWESDYESVVALELTDRIVEENGEKVDTRPM